MSSLSGLEIGLCLLFVSIFLVLSVELYYLLYWKKKSSKNNQDIENQHFSSSNNTPNSLSSYNSCWKTSKSFISQEKDLQNHVKQQDSNIGLATDLVSKSLGEESLDLELMRLHNLGGPPRFLFTINEETKEDLESERSKMGSRTRSMSDLIDTLDTPFLSPLASPAMKVPQQVNMEAYYYNIQNGLNPVFESNDQCVMNKIRSSPPPTFKFLRDAEEKLLKRLMQMEMEKKESFKKKVDQDSPRKTEEKDGSFVKMVVSKGNNNNNNSEGGNLQVTSTHSKVTPLDCSPSTTMVTIDNKW